MRCVLSSICSRAARSGSRTASPPSRPLRTVHASFPAHGSSKPLTIPVALFLREDLKVTKKMHQPLIVEVRRAAEPSRLDMMDGEVLVVMDRLAAASAKAP